jgi:arylsulfatase
MDDMGYADVGVYGAKAYKTPNIDLLGKQGMKFTNFYAAQPVCTASRAGILTGCYPNRIGLTGAIFPGSKKGINSQEETIPEILKAQNYKSIAIGKWHLGDEKVFLPLQHGFDQYFGVPYSNDMSPFGASGKLATEGKRAELPFLPLIEGNKTIKSLKTMEEMAELTTLYTDRAVKFIKESDNEPFFLYMAHSMVHVPLAVSKKFSGKSKQGLYADVMMEVDWSVGEILKALDKKGISKNTLVIFTSDNGPWLRFGNYAGSAGVLREGKVTSWEGGQRVSCLMKWPRVIPANTVNDSLACAIDLLPTFAAITNANLPKKKIDGVNILPLLKGEKVSPRNEILYYYKVNDLNAIRVGNYKLVFPHHYESIAIPGMDGSSGKIQSTSTELALYDLSKDPGEKKDIKDKFPEVVEKLKIAADKAREDLGDSLNKIKGKNIRAVGTIL